MTGDLALMARGCVHLLSLDRTPPDHREAVSIARFAGQVQTPAPDGSSTQVISGAYQLWYDPLPPFLLNLPPWFVIRAGSLPQLSALPLTIGLLDALFAFTLREIAQREHHDVPGWNLAITDRLIRQVIALMHSDLAHGWTLEELGQQVGLSRSALAERFRSAMGDTPLNHLRTLRMQKAIQLLCETRQTLEQIARAVGYQDAFGFSKVFKRSTGNSRRQFREQDALEKQFPYRLREA